MVTRRTLVLGATSALAASAGCVGLGDEGAPTDPPGDREGGTGGTDPEDQPTPTDSSPASYHFRAAPVEVDDLEPVLSTDEPAVAELDALVAVVVEVTESFEVVYRSISAADAAAFEALTEDVQRYYAGNPPGYYIGHEGRRVSVTLGGG
ncbi:hypothetical protein [Natronomonas salsuginis]|jgi:hypothetical protein|uniref:Uncharacterized protein n=1 Tax=Natronomonas salsuginis TaxID=2217661 RepID=A0A4U5JAD1_9EURY|nr:hypothetical protein [Natronomonas salsuginis]TKR25495.1 hypothetical protein DM868_08710 [Natronomonas salsuginis]